MSDTQLLEDVVSAALKAGADAAEAVVAERRSLSVTVRLGDLEEVEREESRDLGLRVFIGKQQATVSASDISPATRARLVERAVAMARLAPEDRYTGLAPEELLAKGPFPDLQLYDPAERGPEALEAAALAAEDAARAIPGVTNSEGGSASWSTGRWSFLTSHGFNGAHQGSVFSLSAGVIASDDGGMERGGEGRLVGRRRVMDLAVGDHRHAGDALRRHIGQRPADRAEELGTRIARRAGRRFAGIDRADLKIRI